MTPGRISQYLWWPEQDPNLDRSRKSKAARKTALTGTALQSRKALQILQYGVLPITALLVETFQFAFAWLTLPNLTIPAQLLSWLSVLASIASFRVPLAGVAFEVSFHLLLLAVVASVVFLLVPVQHLYLRLGTTGTTLLYGVAMATQTVGLMPAVRFLLSVPSCKDGHSEALPAEDCASGTALYYTIMSIAMAITLVVSAVRYEVVSSGVVEKAVRGSPTVLATRGPQHAVAMILLKTAFGLPLALGASMSPMLSTALLATVVALSVVSAVVFRPFWYHSMNAVLVSAFAGALLANCVGLVVLARPEHASSVLVVFAVAVVPMVYMTYTAAHARFFDWSTQSVTAALLADKAAKKHSPAQVSPLDSIPDVHFDLTRVLLGAPAGQFMVLGDTLRLAGCTRVTLADNALTDFGAVSMLAVLPETTAEVDMSRNVFVFEDAVRAGASPTCGLRSLLHRNYRMESLVLDGCRIPLRSLTALVDAICEDGVLKRLSLVTCGLGPDHAKDLGRLLLDAHLEELNARHNDIQAEGAIEIAHALSERPARLHTLNLGWNDIGRTGAMAIVESIQFPLKLAIECNAIPLDVQAQVDEVVRRLQKPSDPSSDTDPSELSLEDVLKGKTIFEALGGKPAVSAVVSTFYLYLVTDPATAVYFKNISMGRMRHLQEVFIGHALGSTTPYKGLSMAAAHAHLGVTDDVFDQTVSHLVAALLFHAPDAPQPILSTIMSVVEGLRASVVDKSTRAPQAGKRRDQVVVV